jgi:hypothetical protein
VLAALIAGTAVAIARDAPVRLTWAGAVPVAISLTWGVWLAPQAAADGSDCANLGSPVATWRMAEAFVVLAALGSCDGAPRPADLAPALAGARVALVGRALS